MKLRKLLLCLLAATMVSSGMSVNAMAAEKESVVSATEDATKEGLEESIEKAESESEEKPEAKKAEAESTEKPEEKKAEGESKEKPEVKKTEKKATKGGKEKESVKKKAAEKKAPYSEAELRLLASLIYCEAGSEPYAGKLAVGIVVVNRKESYKFPNSINGVVYQRYQFGPARNGSLRTALKRYDSGRFTSQNEKDCIKAAKEALSREKKVTYRGKEINMKNFLFFSGRVSGARLTIANHQFK